SSAAPGVQRIEVERRSVEQQAVDTIEHAAVAGDEASGVLGSDAPLDRGFGEITDLSDHAEDDAGAGGARQAARGEEPDAQRPRGAGCSRWTRPSGARPSRGAR